MRAWVIHKYAGVNRGNKKIKFWENDTNQGKKIFPYGIMPKGKSE